jgi:hypothetical protein
LNDIRIIIAINSMFRKGKGFKECVEAMPLSVTISKTMNSIHINPS